MCNLFDGLVRAAIFVYKSAQKHKLSRGCWDLASSQVSLILFSGLRGKVENVSANERLGRPPCFPKQPENKRPKGPHIVHLSTMCHLFNRSARAAIFVYSSLWKTQTRYRMFRSSFLSCFFEFLTVISEKKSKNVSANEKPGRHSIFLSTWKTQTW